MPKTPRDSILCHRGTLRARSSATGALHQDRYGEWWMVKKARCDGVVDKKWCEYNGPLRGKYNRTDGCSIL